MFSIRKYMGKITIIPLEIDFQELHFGDGWKI
jgi:hypothetical protein